VLDVLERLAATRWVAAFDGLPHGTCNHLEVAR
jgi:hypothetical protein